MTKVDRLPRWRLARMNREQREAYDRLRWHRPGPAESARLKVVLGWRRTREETLALADELLGKGLLERVVADRLKVSHRYLHRLLAYRAETTQKEPLNPTIHAADVALTGETDTGVGEAPRPRENGAPPRRFVGLEDLERYLDRAS